MHHSLRHHCTYPLHCTVSLRQNQLLHELFMGWIVSQVIDGFFPRKNILHSHTLHNVISSIHESMTWSCLWGADVHIESHGCNFSNIACFHNYQYKFLFLLLNYKLKGHPVSSIILYIQLMTVRSTHIFKKNQWNLGWYKVMPLSEILKVPVQW
jgi:hypothetical protein